MPPLTARGFADIWRETQMGDTILTHETLEEALAEIRRIRQEGVYLDHMGSQRPLAQHFDFDYGTTKHKRRKDDNKRI
jgi:hypothetical protein